MSRNSSQENLSRHTSQENLSRHTSQENVSRKSSQQSNRPALAGGASGLSLDSGGEDEDGTPNDGKREEKRRRREKRRLRKRESRENLLRKSVSRDLDLFEEDLAAAERAAAAASPQEDGGTPQGDALSGKRAELLAKFDAMSSGALAAAVMSDDGGGANRRSMLSSDDDAPAADGGGEDRPSGRSSRATLKLRNSRATFLTEHLSDTEAVAAPFASRHASFGRLGRRRSKEGRGLARTTSFRTKIAGRLTNFEMRC